MFIVSKYEFDSGKIDILHVEENYKDAHHLCLDNILSDIGKYKEETDSVLMNNGGQSITVYRKSYIHGKYELYRYIVHEYEEPEEEE